MLGFSQTDSDSSMRGATSAINDQKRAENKNRETNRTYQALAVSRVTIFVHEILTRDLHCLWRWLFCRMGGLLIRHLDLPC